MGREAILTPKINSYSFCLSTGVLRHGKWHCTTVPPTVLVHDITEIFLEMLMETRHWPNPSPAPNDIQGCGDCTHVSTFRHYSLYTVNTSMLALLSRSSHLRSKSVSLHCFMSIFTRTVNTIRNMNNLPNHTLHTVLLGFLHAPSCTQDCVRSS